MVPIRRQCLFTIIVHYYILLYSLSYQSRDATEGREFVIPQPWYAYRSEDLDLAYYELRVTTTDEGTFDVTMFEVDGRTTRHSLKKSDFLTLKPDIKNLYSKSGIYPIVHLNSPKNIRVRSLVLVTAHDVMDAYNVMPKISCSHYYIAPTILGDPFINILTFDYPSTNIVINFPAIYPSNFSFPCGDKTARCAPGNSVDLTLEKYHAWYFYIRDGDGRLNMHNTKIMSDKPVYVISGSLHCNIPPNTKRDYCIASVKPTVTWGKEYIAPRNSDQGLVFLFNTLIYPLKVYFISNNQKVNISVQQSHPWFQKKFSQTVVVRSNIAFGLYQISVPQYRNEDHSFISVIPVEQMINHIFYSRNDPFERKDKYILYYYICLANAGIHDIKYLNNANSKPALKKGSDLTLQGATHYSAQISFNDKDTLLYLNKSGSGLALYYKGVDHDRPGTIQSSYGFIFRRIYLEWETDKDYLAELEDRQWSPWADVMDVKCEEGIQTLRVRSCNHKRSRLGGKEKCEGESSIIQCDKAKCDLSCFKHRACADTDSLEIAIIALDLVAAAIALCYCVWYCRSRDGDAEKDAENVKDETKTSLSAEEQKETSSTVLQELVYSEIKDEDEEEKELTVKENDVQE